MAVPSSPAKEEEQPNRLTMRLLMHSCLLQTCDHFLQTHHFLKNARKTHILGTRTSARTVNCAGTCLLMFQNIALFCGQNISHRPKLSP
jgi:hypothetical protein